MKILSQVESEDCARTPLREGLYSVFCFSTRYTAEISIFFSPTHIYNIDQTPLPFEFLQPRTYAPKGSNTIWIQTAHTT